VAKLFASFLNTTIIEKVCWGGVFLNITGATLLKPIISDAINNT
jgi:hypothetical protein